MRLLNSKSVWTCQIFFLASLLCAQSHAAYIVTFTQDGSNVVATGSGTINLSGLTDVAPGAPFPANVDASVAEEELGTAAEQETYSGFTGPSSFGSGGYVNADTASGDAVGIVVNTGNLGDIGIYVPTGYVSGTSLSDTATWDNTTIADLGLTIGTYTYSWDVAPLVSTGAATPNSAAIDTYTVVVSPTSTPPGGGGSSAPLPAGLPLGLLGLGTLAVAIRRYQSVIC
jgi:hypothetical protein